jgi:hypothetical protein
MKKHLASTLHLHVQGHSADAQHHQAVIDAVNQDVEMHFADLEPMCIDEGLDSGNVHHTQIWSEAEGAMWEDFDYNGATFDVGCDDSQRLDWQRLERQAQEFGIWDAEQTARSLGFGVQVAQEDEQDDYLADLLASTASEKVFSPYLSKC